MSQTGTNPNWRTQSLFKMFKRGRPLKYGGYKEIQSPKRKCVLIDINALIRLAGFDDFTVFQESHRQWVDNAIAQKTNLKREFKWTESIAVGNEGFLTRVKRKMQALSVGRRVRPTAEGFELRETIDPYNSHFEAERCDIDANNT